VRRLIQEAAEETGVRPVLVVHYRTDQELLLKAVRETAGDDAIVITSGHRALRESPGPLESPECRKATSLRDALPFVCDKEQEPDVFTLLEILLDLPEPRHVADALDDYVKTAVPSLKQGSSPC
jgi:hypothetical protein